MPRLNKVWHTPGLNGNGKDLGRGEGALAHAEANGWTRIPHTIECEAFGSARRPGTVADSTYLERHHGNHLGRMVDYFTDAWTRPRAIGHLTTWERDHDGWKDFLRRCLATVWEGELDEVQIRIAVDPVVNVLRHALTRESVTSRQAVDASLRNLPAAYVPDDLRSRYDDFHAARAATRGRAKTSKEA